MPWVLSAALAIGLLWVSVQWWRSRRAQEVLQRRLDLTVESAQVGTWELDLVRNTRGSARWNAAFSAHHGFPYEAREATSEDFYLAVDTAYRADVEEAFTRFLSGQDLCFEETYRTSEGCWITIKGITVDADDEGVPTRVFGTSIDSTLLQHSESQVTKISRRLTDAIEALDLMLVIYDQDERLLVYNQRFVEFFPKIAKSLHPGAQFEEILRTNIDCLQRSTPEERERLEEVYTQSLADFRCHAKNVLRNINGRYFRFSYCETREQGTVIVGEDVSTMHQLTEQLRRAKEEANHSKGEFLAH